MKKTLFTAAALLGLAAASQAAIINWGLAAKTTLGGVTQAGATAHLMFLDPDNSTNLIVLDTRLTQVSPPVAAGNLAPDFSAEQTISHNDAIAGTAYSATTGQAGFFVRVFSMDNQYFIDSATFDYTGSPTQMMSYSAPMNFGTTLPMGSAVNPDTNHSSGGWTPVPEPATGMLALAGAAMLLRRRRRT